MKTNPLVLVIVIAISLTFCNKSKEVIKPLVKKESIQVSEKSKEPCVFDSPNQVYLSKLSDVTKMYALRKKMISGDSEAYYEMKDIYYLSGRGDGFTYMALIMANKTGFPDAFFEVYRSLHGIDTNGWEIANEVESGLRKLDPETRNLAFSYLKKAAAKGHKDAIEELKKYDSKGNLKK